ncbi:MAG: hypothetical protein JOZ81_01970 [Chloroflexi bacterium]|nr:hypothetical protein [Chloroflexota bacterium]
MADTACSQPGCNEPAVITFDKKTRAGVLKQPWCVVHAKQYLTTRLIFGPPDDPEAGNEAKVP